MSNCAGMRFELHDDGSLWLWFAYPVGRDELTTNPLVEALVDTNWTLRPNSGGPGTVAANDWVLEAPSP